MSHLRWLEVGGNSGLTGPIPAALGNLTDLESLSLQENWLTGSIPAVLGHLSNLQWLALDRNALTGSIPSELGNLTHLRHLKLNGNMLSGRIPPELGGLTGLIELDLDGNMLSGPLPARLTRLSALERLQLDGSGLCAPDTPAVRAWLATIRDFMGAVCDGSVTFLRVVTQPDLGLFTDVVAVTDLDGDGRDDVLVADYLEYHGTPEERSTKMPLSVLVNDGDGSFRHAPELVEGTIDVRTPIVVADDFNGDGRGDLAVFDAGRLRGRRSGWTRQSAAAAAEQSGRTPPAIRSAGGRVRREHELRPDPKYSGPADLHLKSATSGDIDGDGDVDLWVESSGGSNVDSHFMMNNGDGTFTLDDARAPNALIHNLYPEYWRHVGNDLVDLDNDGDLDLALGQIRDFAPHTINMFSIVLVAPRSGRTPHPARPRLSAELSRDVVFRDPFAKGRVDARLPSATARPEVLDHVPRQADGGRHLRIGAWWPAPANGRPSELLRPAISGKVRSDVLFRTGAGRAFVPVHWLSSC